MLFFFIPYLNWNLSLHESKPKGEPWRQTLEKRDKDESLEDQNIMTVFSQCYQEL